MCKARFSAEHITSTIYLYYVFIAINLYFKTQLLICRLRQRLVQNVSVLKLKNNFIRRSTYMERLKLSTTSGGLN